MVPLRGITVTALPSKPPRSTKSPPAHHVGSPPHSFRNPWPSFRKDNSLLDILRTRFGSGRNFIPVPPRDELVQIRKPDWGNGRSGLKATWIGHASFLVETTATQSASRGIRIVFDPLFSERTSPVTWAGPKRYSPTPCALEEVPDVDLVVISHNHYDHLDAPTIEYLNEKMGDAIHFFCALGNKQWFYGMGVAHDKVTELDWWDGVRVDVDGVGSAELFCTPSQHFSGRGVFDHGSTLWCSWVLQEMSGSVRIQDGSIPSEGLAQPPGRQQGDVDSVTRSQDDQEPDNLLKRHRLFFAGDTGYRTVPPDHDPSSPESAYLSCPAFTEIGTLFGPFALALLPIGLYSPRHFLSPVHCTPEDSLCIHKDIKSDKSIGMHWGTVRGGISQEYEDVREPPRRWREACERRGLKWGEEIGLLDIGETIVIP